MIEAEHSTEIALPIAEVWAYVQDISRWALLFPGCRECEVIDANDSRWTIKVGAGGLVKTVKVLVHVDRWAGPEAVDFSFKLEGEPVQGSGAYLATANGARATAISMKLRVEGSGPMAPMWEAVSKPLLPQIARSFAASLKAELEASAPPRKASWLRRLADWLKNFWRTGRARTD